MARMTSPNGITVNVSDEKAAQLASVGYKPAEQEAKAPAKKAASSKSKTSK
jgi:hypothetical protein